MSFFGGIPTGRGYVRSKSWAGNGGVTLVVYFMLLQGMSNPKAL